MKLRDYQQLISDQACKILSNSKFVYLAMQVRTGKTLTSLSIANAVGAQNVLFVTKKKAMSSINDDCMLLKPNYDFWCVNYESLHKFDTSKIDFIILDEAHGMGAYPRPSQRAQVVRNSIGPSVKKVIFLSGTPTPESYSQMYHQMWVLGDDSPFAKYSNFYKWAKDYVDIKQKKINSLMINDYDRAYVEMVDNAMSPYTISFTQEEAGFESSVDEEVLYVPADKVILQIAEKLKKDSIVEGKDEVILADTGAKMMQKLHQLYSGTIIFESGKSQILSTAKADFIKNKFEKNRVAVFYKFKAEAEAIKQVYGDNITDDLAKFQDGLCNNFMVQIVTGREGVNLSAADFLIFYNIDFSATSYWQARDRMTTKQRTVNKVYWIFTSGGIEEKIYKVVNKKRTYTLSHFKKDFLNL